MLSRRTHQLLHAAKRFKTWYLVALALALTLICLYSLRQNNLTSVALRNQVYRVDQANGDVEAALNNLRRHIYRHMMSGLSTDGGAYPPVQLKYRYERLVAAQKQQASGAGSQIYTEAQRVCEQRFPVGLSGSGRIPCIENYVASRQPPAEKPIPDALYKFDFAAPVWSPDLAGITLILAAVCWLLVIVRVAVGRWLAHRLD